MKCSGSINASLFISASVRCFACPRATLYPSGISTFSQASRKAAVMYCGAPGSSLLLWAREGWIDYNIPQVYWEIGHKAADYETLVKWWWIFRGGIIPLFFCFEKVADKACQWNRLLIFFKPYHVFYLCYKQLGKDT